MIGTPFLTGSHFVERFLFEVMQGCFIPMTVCSLVRDEGKVVLASALLTGRIIYIRCALLVKIHAVNRESYIIIITL